VRSAFSGGAEMIATRIGGTTLVQEKKQIRQFAPK
jgi:hypothetical protein